MEFLLTCSAGLESLAKNEVIKQWWIITQVKDRLIFFEGDITLMAKINLWSRVGNKVYIVANKKEHTTTFDELYDIVYQINWKNFINQYYPVVVKATSIKSSLSSTPALQKITKKAIVDKMTWKSGHLMPEENNKPIFEVLSFFIEDNAYILINTSGETLYKRWYKEDTWEAPIKESLASALILLSRWKYTDTFYDIFCWSGTIAIEAALFAKNIAPWLYRYFSFENWNLLPKNYFQELRETAKKQIYPQNYTIIASDINKDVLEKAKINAKNAKVSECISFELKDFRAYKNMRLSWLLISNPPYGLRLQDDNLNNLYKDISFLFKKNKNLQWWIITSYTEFDTLIDKNNFKKRKLYNWNELCYFYMKK